ncbi:hypothetical protein [Bacteroides caecigallinarum]|uniref:hypothetical protein n=1 Tax=Bacteroides caecigallinarum TaxID=1411144 RepID=UPI0019587BD5|nr:hypothetical protein [Bacteroides caecigallinarum]MBM6884165.1 hypothetical protein [Bacteroides caecigallinarum]
MRKKYLSALLFGALLVTSAGTFTSCKADCNEIGLGTQTIGFWSPEFVYDAHLHIDDATVSRWGIKDINGTSFTVTKRPDNVTVANFVVEVHYVCLDGTPRTVYVPYRVGKSYAHHMLRMMD